MGNISRFVKSSHLSELRGDESKVEGQPRAAAELAGFPTTEGRTIFEPDFFIMTVEGELAADKARSRANALAGRDRERVGLDAVAQEQELQEFEAELRQDLLRVLERRPPRAIDAAQ